MASSESIFFGPIYTAYQITYAPGSGAIAAFLIVSHLFELLGVAYALKARLAQLGVAGLFSLIVSALLYHPCASQLYCLSTPVNQWRQADHMAQLWLVGALGLHLMMTVWAPRRAQYFFRLAGHFLPAVAILAVLTLPYTLLSGIIMAIYLVIILVARLAVLPCSADLCGLAPDNDGSSGDPHSESNRKKDIWTGIWIGIGVFFAVVGLVLFYALDDEPAGTTGTVKQALLHGTWHICAGIALIALSVATTRRLEEALHIHSQQVDAQREVHRRKRVLIPLGHAMGFLARLNEQEKGGTRHGKAKGEE